PPPPTSPPPRAMTHQPSMRSMTHQPSMRSMLDSSSYTLSNGAGGTSPTRSSSVSGGGKKKGKIVPVHDLRWRFVDESQFPKPREFVGVPKKYRAGRGSSVPLDLSA
ncbi:hypothetical protein P280DRAFT_385288, partial [Massarina eburnea CBS 473.64]